MHHTVFLTGASGGFGRLAATALLARGHRVAAGMRDPGGRNAAIAAALRDAGAEVVALDVTDEASVEAAAAAATVALGPVDVVVNAAGIGVSGWQEAFTAADLHRGSTSTCTACSASPAPSCPACASAAPAWC